MYMHLCIHTETQTHRFVPYLLISITISHKENYFSIQLQYLSVPSFTLHLNGPKRGWPLWEFAKIRNQDTQIKIWLRFIQNTMGLLPWVLTHLLSYAVRIPFAIQTRTPFSGETHTQKCMRSLMGTGLLPWHADVHYVRQLPCLSASLKMPCMNLFFPSLCAIVNPNHLHFLKTLSSSRSTPGEP